MQPHQERVVTELNELNDKINKLNSFIGGEVFASLAKEEQSLLLLQADVMSDYANILKERILAFPVDK